MDLLNEIRLNRRITQKIWFLLDQLIPPVIRDLDLLAKPVFYLLFGKRANIFLNYQKNALTLTDREYEQIYKKMQFGAVNRETDLLDGIIDEIQKKIVGKSVLEVGFGKAHLTKLISKKYKVTAVDIIVDKKFILELPNVNFKKANIENLPFKNKSFDTVICTHTLEHVLNISDAIKELRRVARHRLIIVVPKQRPYKFTFDLHLHFFPYPESFLNLVGRVPGKHFCKEICGDFFYYEDITFKYE